MRKETTGILTAMGIIIFPIFTFFFIYPYSGALSFDQIVVLYSHPVTIGYILITIVGVIILTQRNFNVIKQYMKTRDPQRLQVVQELLVGFPKTMLYFGMVIGILTPQIILFFHPGGNALRLDAVLLGFGNEIFFGMPAYILFIQQFEHWARTVPFSDRYQSMKVSMRVNLVLTFVLISMSGMLMITLKNSFANISGEASFALVWQRSAPVLAVGFFGGFANMFLLMRGITKRIKLCQEFADSLASGHILAGETIAISRDELGVLADRLGKTRLNMHELIGSAKNTISESLQVKDELGAMAGKTVSAVSGLTGQISSAVAQIESLDERIEGTTGSVNRFSERIKTLTDGIVDQAAMIEESNAGITEIIASVENISEVAQVKIQNSASLLKASDEGNVKIAETVSQLNEISEQVGKINEMTGLIQTIAAQTNLLAMNAAIEAAHAGDAGKGFAVVADEIRKLASNASKNSKQINDSVKQIVSSIESANVSGESSVDSFKRIEGEITNVLRSFQEIDTGLGELKVGGVHILEAVTALNDSSQKLKIDADAMTEEAEITGRAVSDLRSLSEQTYKVTEKMTNEVLVVKEQAETINDQSVRLDNATRKAAESLEGFDT